MNSILDIIIGDIVSIERGLHVVYVLIMIQYEQARQVFLRMIVGYDVLVSSRVNALQDDVERAIT